MDGPHPPTPDANAHRLTTLEEHAAFTERTVEQLSSEVAELGKRIHTLAARVEALEARLRKALEPPAEDADTPDA